MKHSILKSTLLSLATAAKVDVGHFRPSYYYLRHYDSQSDCDWLSNDWRFEHVFNQEACKGFFEYTFESWYPDCDDDEVFNPLHIPGN